MRIRIYVLILVNFLGLLVIHYGMAEKLKDIQVELKVVRKILIDNDYQIDKSKYIGMSNRVYILQLAKETAAAKGLSKVNSLFIYSMGKAEMQRYRVLFGRERYFELLDSIGKNE